MATIKSYTDISQSKTLSKILPLESADCFWDYDDLQKYHRISWFEEGYDKDSQLRTNENNVCAWSLAALLDVLPYPHIEQNYKGKWTCRVEHGNTTYLWEDSNPVDACVAIIEKMNVLKIL